MTDITQPMHSRNYQALDKPVKLRAHFESYALRFHDVVGREPLETFVPPAPGASPDDVLVSAARASNALWPESFGAIQRAWNARCGPFDLAVLDDEACWENDPGVDATVVESLRRARDNTASYLYAASSTATLTPAVRIGDAISVTSMAWHEDGLYVTSGNRCGRRRIAHDEALASRHISPGATPRISGCAGAPSPPERSLHPAYDKPREGSLRTPHQRQHPLGRGSG